MGMNQKEFDIMIPQLINAIDRYPENEFFLDDIYPNPQAHMGTFFHKSVDAGKFPNIEFMKIVEGRADKYRKIN